MTVDEGIKRQIVGALRSTIEAHGPITKGGIESAAKRIASQIGAYERPCLVCAGVGAINGFWIGTIKTCPACHGRGRQP